MHSVQSNGLLGISEEMNFLVVMNFSSKLKIFSISKIVIFLYETSLSLWFPTIMSWSLFQLLELWFWHLNNFCQINVDLKPVLSLRWNFALSFWHVSICATLHIWTPYISFYSIWNFGPSPSRIERFRSHFLH